MKALRLGWLLGLLVLVGSAGCRSENNAPSHGPRKLEVTRTHDGPYPIKVVCTTGMIADVVRNVGGAHVEVDQLFGQDVDPHQYKATPADVGRLKAANVIFYNGLHLEGKMGELLERMGRTVPSFPVAEFLDESKLLKDEEGNADPHVWFDVRLWGEVAGLVGEALAKYDPKHAGDYQQAADKYRKKLDGLHADVTKRIQSIPESGRVLITSHDAFRYFGKAYGIEVRGIQGISTEAEASVRDINQLVDFITKRKVKAVFVESSVNPRNMRSLIEGCRRNGHAVAEGGELFSDAMGAAGTEEGTYVGMINHNVETIVKALK